MVRQSSRIGYSLNVFPDESLEELRTTLRTHAARIRREAYGDREFPVELRLSARMVEELTAQPNSISDLRDMLVGEGLRLVTLNSFVPISFHQPNLKEQVYLPSWHEGEERIRYTCKCADLLAALAPASVKEPTLSVPGGVLKRDFANTPHVHEKTAGAMRQCAQHCAELRDRTGRHLRIGIEPEPGLTYERTDEVISFFDKFFPRAEDRRHIGVNFDLCHQLVEFEDLWSSVSALARAKIAITKIHVSNCIEVGKPLVAPELMQLLKTRYAESKFLHQTAGVNAAGERVYFSLDLPEVLVPEGLRAMSRAGVEKLRIHYHMPLMPGGSVPTTLKSVENFMRRLSQSELDVPLVIETYTWLEQLGTAGRKELIDNIVAEIDHTSRWL